MEPLQDNRAPGPELDPAAIPPVVADFAARLIERARVEKERQAKAAAAPAAPAWDPTDANERALGPVVEVRIGLAAADQAERAAAGVPLPVPILAGGMIDTGASCSVIRSGVAELLGLAPTGTTTIHSASHASVSARKYTVRLVVGEGAEALDWEGTVTELPLRGQHIDCLIGRDVLAAAEKLVYTGQTAGFRLLHKGGIVRKLERDSAPPVSPAPAPGQKDRPQPGAAAARSAAPAAPLAEIQMPPAAVEALVDWIASLRERHAEKQRRAKAAARQERPARLRLRVKASAVRPVSRASAAA